MESPGSISGQCCVEPHWPSIQTGHNEAESAGSAGGIQPEGPSVSFLEKGDLLVMMTQMKLRNAANYCYCNATFFCLWWTILSRHAYSSGDWGASQDAVQSFFSCLDDQPRSIAECFGVLFEIWAHDTSPADAAEFAQSVLLDELTVPATQMGQVLHH